MQNSHFYYHTKAKTSVSVNYKASDFGLTTYDTTGFSTGQGRST